MNSLSFAMQAKLEEGKGPGRAVQGENHRLKKGRARTFYASFVHGATARGHHSLFKPPVLGPESHSRKGRNRCRDWEEGAGTVEEQFCRTNLYVTPNSVLGLNP